MHRHHFQKERETKRIENGQLDRHRRPGRQLHSFDVHHGLFGGKLTLPSLQPTLIPCSVRREDQPTPILA